MVFCGDGNILSRFSRQFTAKYLLLDTFSKRRWDAACHYLDTFLSLRNLWRYCFLFLFFCFLLYCEPANHQADSLPLVKV